MSNAFHSAARRVRARLTNLKRDQRGSVAIMFALASVPLIGLSGAAIDYSVASRDRALLQTAVDSAALAIAKSPAVLQADIDRLVRANLTANYVPTTNRVPTVTATKLQETARVVASDNVPKTFRLFPGMSNTTTINAEAEVRWGTNNIEIALVLDNTGSMSWSNKMEELKKALCGDQTCSSTNPSTGFVKIIKDAATRPAQFMVGLVPFDVNVRVPVAWQNTVNTGSPVSDPFLGGAGIGYCMHGALSDTAEAVGHFRFSPRDKDLRSNQMWHGVNVGYGCGAPRMTPTNWQGCVGDRDQLGDFDTKDDLVPGVMAQRHPAIACFSPTLARMLPMVDILTGTSDIITGLRSMQPSGNTNLSIGVSWGTAMLTNREPFTEARAPGDTSVRRFMILLTDGDNTQSKHSNGSGGIDPRTRMACDYAKAQNITIYSIRVIDGNRTLLQNCASTPSHYKEVANAAQLTPVFQQIASEIGALRLSH